MSDPKISAEEFDRLFDEGEEDITQYLDLESGFHPEKSDLSNCHYIVERNVTQSATPEMIEYRINNRLQSISPVCTCEEDRSVLMIDCPKCHKPYDA